MSLSMLCTECRVPKYEPLDPERTYTVVTNSYMVGGGDGYSMIKEELLKHNTGGQKQMYISFELNVLVAFFFPFCHLKTFNT